MMKSSTFRFGVIVGLIITLAVLNFYTTCTKYLIFTILNIFLVPSVFIFLFKQKKWQIHLIGVLLIFTCMTFISQLTEDYYFSKSSVLVVGKINKKEINVKGKHYLNYTYGFKEYSNTLTTSVGRKYLENLGSTVLVKIAEDRPWYNRIVLAADSNHINEIVKNRMKE